MQPTENKPYLWISLHSTNSTEQTRNEDLKKIGSPNCDIDTPANLLVENAPELVATEEFLTKWNEKLLDSNSFSYTYNTDILSKTQEFVLTALFPHGNPQEMTFQDRKSFLELYYAALSTSLDTLLEADFTCKDSFDIVD